MALVTRIRRIPKERNSVHKATECSVSIFSDEAGSRYMQLDTFGSSARTLKGKVSQSLQFDRNAALQLKAIIEEAFPGL
jgi:hypothetical protein